MTGTRREEKAQDTASMATGRHYYEVPGVRSAAPTDNTKDTADDHAVITSVRACVRWCSPSEREAIMVIYLRVNSLKIYHTVFLEPQLTDDTLCKTGRGLSKTEKGSLELRGGGYAATWTAPICYTRRDILHEVSTARDSDLAMGNS